MCGDVGFSFYVTASGLPHVCLVLQLFARFGHGFFFCNYVRSVMWQTANGLRSCRGSVLQLFYPVPAFPPNCKRKMLFSSRSMIFLLCSRHSAH
jgi:hypothetical protein